MEVIVRIADEKYVTKGKHVRFLGTAFLPTILLVLFSILITLDLHAIIQLRYMSTRVLFFSFVVNSPFEGQGAYLQILLSKFLPTQTFYCSCFLVFYAVKHFYITTDT